MNVPRRVLIVDDDGEIRCLLCNYLLDYGFQPIGVESGIAMHTAMATHHFDMIILDLMLPGEDGLSLCRHLRTTTEIPIIMLTARGESSDRVVGLELGADDYIIKPFDPRELLARIEAVLRRKSGASALTKDAPVHFGNFVFDPVTRQLMRGSEIVKLTGGEINLLEALVRNAGNPLSRERLLTLARDDESGERNDRAIDIAVLRLRRVIEDDPKQPRWIQTVWGTGYRFSP